MKIAGRILFWLPSLLLVASGIVKIYLSTQPIEKLPSPDIAGKLIPLAILELAVVAFYIILKTRNIGFLLICSYLGGAIATVVMGSTPANALSPSIILALFWIGKYINDKKFFFPHN